MPNEATTLTIVFDGTPPADGPVRGPGDRDTKIGGKTQLDPGRERDKIPKLPQPPVASEFNPELQAMRQMHQEQNRREVEAARLRIDREYAEQQRQMQMAAQQRQIAQFAQAAGSSQAAGAISAAAGGPIAMALMLTQEIKKTIDEQIELFHQRTVGTIQGLGQFGSGVLSGSPGAFAQQLADASRNIPVFGREVSAAAHQLVDLNRAAESASRRLAEYNPALAMQVWSQDWNRTVREMQRSYRFGDNYARYIQSQQPAEEVWARFMDRFSPAVLAVLTSMNDQLTMMGELADGGFKALLENLEGQLAEVQSWIPWRIAALENLQGLLQQMRQDPNNTGIDVWVTQLQASINSIAGNVRPAPLAPQQVAPNLFVP